MKIDWPKITVIGYLIFALTACTQVANPNQSTDATPSQPELTPMAPTLPPQGDSTPMTPATPTPAASGQEKIIELAKEDLAQRLSISTDQISLVEATEVEWSDSSLDCPQPDMVYLQVITPGFRILLESSGKVYEYHSNRDAYVVYCENPISPFLPKP